jgi:8-oxo-dGTP diphosphatase
VTTPIDVCAAVIRRDGKILLATRPPGSHLAGKWEFPGGKCAAGESTESCISREILEELHLSVRSAVPVDTLVHRYPDKTVRLFFLECDIDPGADPVPREGQDVGWFGAREAAELDLAPADRVFLNRFFPLPRG